jgi:hypothetical protein
MDTIPNAEGRECPRLLVELPLEGEPSFHLQAADADDQERLVLWLRRSLDRVDLAAPVVRWLDREAVA